MKTCIDSKSRLIANQTGGYDADRYFLLHDRLGSVRLVIDTSGNVKNRYIYDPFGRLHDNSSDFEELLAACGTFRFTGQQYDSEIGQYYLRARMYDPYTTRFTSRDPAFGQFQQPLTLHRYLYCQNDPLNRIDPAGLWAYYLTGGAMGSFLSSVSGQVGIVWDDKGNWGYIAITGVGAGWPAASVGLSLGITNADTILDLRGPGHSGGAGFSTPYLIGGGADLVWGPAYKGIQFNIGAGVSVGSFEAHRHQTQTYVRPMHSETLTFEDIVRMPVEQAFQQAETLGEYHAMCDFMVMTGLGLDVLFYSY